MSPTFHHKALGNFPEMSASQWLISVSPVPTTIDILAARGNNRLRCAPSFDDGRMARGLGAPRTRGEPTGGTAARAAVLRFVDDGLVSVQTRMTATRFVVDRD